MLSLFIVMQLRLLFALAFTSIGFTANADAAPTWQDGPAANIDTLCGLAGPVYNTTIVTKAGLLVDPIALTPKLGQVVTVHGVATNMGCASEDVVIDFKLPPGARLADTTQFPVKCHDIRVIGTAVDQWNTNELCLQQPIVLSNGALRFMTGKLLVPTNSTQVWTLEIQVPVIYDSAAADALTIMTSWRSQGQVIQTVVASTGQPVPFQQALPPMGQPQPSPQQPPVPSNTRGEDLVLLGSSLADAGTLPVAFSNDDGSFTVTNHIVGDFAGWARQPNVTRLTGDFNKDGYVDYALVGGPGWRSIPVAMSNGDGTFTVTNHDVGDFGAWADAPSGAKPLAADFNSDGHTDIALVGGAGWGSIPVAFSSGNGAFVVTNFGLAGFPTWATAQGARAIVGDFNKDGRSDIALVGGNGWTMIPVAYGYGNGTFLPILAAATATGNHCSWYPCYYQWNFAQAAQEPGTQVIATDFNKDGATDLLLVGGSSPGIRFAMGATDNTFQRFERHDISLATYARVAGVKVLTGDFNKDGWVDLVLTGVSGWNHFPVVTNLGGNGFWSTSNKYVGAFGALAAEPGVRQVIGDFNGDGFSDIALTGGSWWTSIPVAFNNGNGFTVPATFPLTTRFPGWAKDTSASVFVGRLNQ
jgi:hypothetical protein